MKQGNIPDQNLPYASACCHSVDSKLLNEAEKKLRNMSVLQQVKFSAGTHKH